MGDVDLMLRFLLQILAVMGLCRVVGWLGKRYLGQTQVVMEMVTGVVLGPSVFGALAPDVQGWLFPNGIIATVNGTPVKHPSMSVLYIVAQIGLVLYMFLVGLEFNLEMVSGRAKAAIGVSAAGIVAPFLLGAGLAVAFVSMGRTDLFAPSVTSGEAALYMGAAMCITAFPMLARILYENGIAGTSMGTLALGAGASDDATAWALLAVVLASYKEDAKYALFAILGSAIFATLVLTLGRRFFARMGETVAREGSMSQTMFAGVMFFLFAGAYITDAVGIYAVFGAFLVGSAMPRGAFVEAIRNRVEAITVSCFLPFFFVYSGLNTKIGLVNTPELWLICGLVCLAAIVGKFGGCTLAARVAGEKWREATAIGVLMNSRGLMELIILNIGLQQKLITPTLFTMMVIMAIVTTLMTSPLFRKIYPSSVIRKAAGDVAMVEG